MYTVMHRAAQTHKIQTLSAFPVIYYAASSPTAQVLDMAVILLKTKYCYTSLLLYNMLILHLLCREASCGTKITQQHERCSSAM